MKNKAFLIVVDFQADFVLSGAKLPVRNAEYLIAPMACMLANLDPDEIEGVLFTYDTHDAEPFAESEEGAMFPLHCEKGTPGWELVLNPRLVPAGIPTYTMEKGVFDMWAEKDLKIAPMGKERDAFFDRLKSFGIERIIVAGVAADFCVKDAITGLVARGFNVEVVRGLTAGIERNIDQTVAEEFPDNVEIV